MDTISTKGEHLARHIELHHNLDELLADFMKHTGNVPVSEVPIGFLMKWSHKQTIMPDE